MGYRSDVAFVAIVPSREAAQECLNTFQVSLKLDAYTCEAFSDVDHCFTITGDEGNGYISDHMDHVKWYEDFEDVTLIIKFYTDYLPSFFTTLNKPYSVSFKRLGEDSDDVEYDEWHSDCERFQSESWETIWIVRELSLNVSGRD